MKSTRKRTKAKWIEEAVFYEIYPQTFFDSNNDGIGDLRGIIQKLDYVKSLGVNAIWLNPFYLSPFRDAGYDVVDFCKVAPRYGTNADAKKLFAEAKKRGIKVIIDFVPGHTSIDHEWFKQSSSPTPNKYSNRYVWTDNAWDSGGGEFAGKMIHGHCDRNGNFLNNFFWHQPALNFGFAKPEKPWQLSTKHPDVRQLWDDAKEILEFWLKMGVSGFRVDMAGSIIRKDPDAIESQRFWNEVRDMLETKYPEAFTVSEWSFPKHALGGGFHADFFHWFKEYEDLFRKEPARAANNFPGNGHSFFDAQGKGDISGFLSRYMEHYAATKDKGFISIPVGNHDLSRININRTPRELEGIYAFLLTMPGVPFMYYGDEIGMRQVPNVPVKEGCYPPRSGARTPMQWKSGKNLGFSDAPAQKLWLPVDPAKNAPTVESCEKDADSILHKTRQLIKMRRAEKALAASADFRVIYAEKNKYPFVYERCAENERILVALNPCNKPVKISLKDVTINSDIDILAGIDCTLVIDKKITVLEMKGSSYGVFKYQSGK